MTTEAAQPAFENPLIPNAKLKQLYCSMVQMRLLGDALSTSRRRTAPITAGLEACLAATSVDLTAGDRVSDALSGGVIDYIRGAALESVLRPERPLGKRGTRADCGLPLRLLDFPGVEERVWAALGVAASLKAVMGQKQSGTDEDGAKDSALITLYTRAGEVAPGLWKRALAFASLERLPVMFVVLPAAKGYKSTTTPSSIAIRHGIPGIPVDAGDAVAIYRVAQETIGRLRAGDGPVLIECVLFRSETSGRAGRVADAIAGIEQYMLSRNVVTRKWIERERTLFQKRIRP